MKLSICIPIFQCDVNGLVNELVLQSKEVDDQIEVLLLDDGSDQTYRDINRGLGDLKEVTYTELGVNSGRSKVRNSLCALASGQFILFLDADSGVVNADFLTVYLRYIAQDYSVVYGGRCYESIPEKGKALRWNFGVERESKLAKFRQRDMYRYFMSNNFAISKSLIRQLKFDSDIEGYGYEDSVLASQLAAFEIDVKHIDNAVLHTVYETNEKFMDQTINAVKNLRILELKGDPAVQTIAMLRLKVKMGVLVEGFRIMHGLFGKRLEQNLRGSGSGLWMFDLYRFSLLCSLS